MRPSPAHSLKFAFQLYEVWPLISRYDNLRRRAPASCLCSTLQLA